MNTLSHKTSGLVAAITIAAGLFIPTQSMAEYNGLNVDIGDTNFCFSVVPSNCLNRDGKKNGRDSDNKKDHRDNARDHRTPADTDAERENTVVKVKNKIRDHRVKVRDHRTSPETATERENTVVQVGERVRDHRTKIIVRDHR